MCIFRIYTNIEFIILQHVSIVCYAERRISYDIPSVCPSQSGRPIMSCYDHEVFSLHHMTLYSFLTVERGVAKTGSLRKQVAVSQKRCKIGP